MKKPFSLLVGAGVLLLVLAGCRTYAPSDLADVPEPSGALPAFAAAPLCTVEPGSHSGADDALKLALALAVPVVPDNSAMTPETRDQVGAVLRVLFLRTREVRIDPGQEDAALKERELSRIRELGEHFAGWAAFYQEQDKPIGFARDSCMAVTLDEPNRVTPDGLGMKIGNRRLFLVWTRCFDTVERDIPTDREMYALCRNLLKLPEFQQRLRELAAIPQENAGGI